MRLPRTLLGLLVGAALGVAGAVMQALTRNPLADPGLLGINAGASAAVVTAIASSASPPSTGYVWFALARRGGGVRAGLRRRRRPRRHPGPARAGRYGASAPPSTRYVSAVMLLDTAALDRLRFWTVGSLASRGHRDRRPRCCRSSLVGLLRRARLPPGR